MSDLKHALKTALETALSAMHLPDGVAPEVVIQETPADKPGDYGSALAFGLAKALRQNPAQIAKDLAARVELPTGIAKAEAVGPYLNFFVDAPGFVADVVSSRYTPRAVGKKVIVEHTSVNPNKEWHVGHIRGALIGDALGRIYRASGYTVEIQNYIDDTGRQAAESLFAAQHYNKDADWLEVYAQEAAALPVDSLDAKFDHWLGGLYVRLHKDFPKDSPQKLQIEPGIAEVTHALERGELRPVIERVVRAHLQTAQSLGVEYDLLTWESDVVGAGFVQKALDILETSPYLLRPTEGQYAGTLGIDVSAFAPGLEEPYKVLVRSNGTFVYVTKDIGFHYWKFGLFEGLKFKTFAEQQLEKPLYTTAPDGAADDAKRFAHGVVAINVIDARQSLQQIIVKASLNILEYAQEHAKNLHHLANETVLLEGQTMSGRKGITVSADEVIQEAQSRALALTNPDLENPGATARIIGLGALKFAFLKASPERQIDFRWDVALALQGDTAPVVQYAHARARKIGREYTAKGLSGEADWTQITGLELELAKVVVKYPEVLALCIREDSPHPMCAYALELAGAFNGWYNHRDANGKSDTNILYSPPGLREARLALVARVADAIQDALGTLGIEAPNEM
jgi:arginyl-tRNA synthetase